MTSREKKLGIVTAVAFGLLLGWLMVDRLFLKPIAQADATIESRRREVEKLRARTSRETRYLRRLRSVASRCFGTDELAVRDAVRTHLMDLIARSGLTLENLQAVSGENSDGFREVGRMVRAVGSLDQAISFLYLLDAQPQLHKVENLSIQPDKGSDTVELRLRYTTLIPKLPPGVSPPGSQPAPDAGDLDSDRRRQYDLIVRRDLFRPYVKRPPTPQVTRRPEPEPQPRPEPEPEPEPAPRPSPGSHLQVISLSQWGGEQDVTIRDRRNGQTRTYHPGDRLAGGRIAAVDYRPMPRRDNPQLNSPSRVILKLGPDYWAVELGTTLATRRRLKKAELPEGLRPAPSTQPAGQDVSRAGGTDASIE